MRTSYAESGLSENGPCQVLTDPSRILRNLQSYNIRDCSRTVRNNVPRQQLLKPRADQNDHKLLPQTHQPVAPHFTSQVTIGCSTLESLQNAKGLGARRKRQLAAQGQPSVELACPIAISIDGHLLTENECKRSQHPKVACRKRFCAVPGRADNARFRGVHCALLGHVLTDRFAGLADFNSTTIGPLGNFSFPHLCMKYLFQQGSFRFREVALAQTLSSMSRLRASCAGLDRAVEDCPNPKP